MGPWSHVASSLHLLRPNRQRSPRRADVSLAGVRASGARCRARDDRRAFDAGGKRAEVARPAAREPRRAERVGDGRGACCTSSAACSASAMRSTRSRARSSARRGRRARRAARRPRVEARVAPRARRARRRARRRLGSLRIARSTSRHCTLPLPSQIALSGASRIQARQHRLLDVAAAAEALHRLARCVGRALADPVLADRRRDAREARSRGSARGRARARRACVSAVAPRSRAPGRRARCASAAARRAGCRTPAVARVVQRLRERHAHGRPPSRPCSRSRVWRTISMIVRTPRPSLAEHPRECAAQLDLARRVRDVAELVLEPLHLERVAACRRAASAAAGSTSAPPRRLREHEERVAHRRGEEPLVADQLVRLAGPSAPSGLPAWCSRARRCRPASRSCPCRSSRPACRRRARCAGRSACARTLRLPSSPAPASCAAWARTRRSS